jgi:iron complex outermembrane recepter protein
LSDRNFSLLPLTAVALGAGLFTIHESRAQETAATDSTQGLQEIIVTARRREESIQEVPVSITSISGEALQQASVQRVEDLRFVAPSLQISPSPFGNSVPGYTIRGQRQLEALATQDPSVVMYFAEVPMMRPHGTNGSFFDLQSVQVLKGPQGTLFGRNTTGGAVLVTPNRPEREFGAEIDAGFGNYGAYSTGGFLNVPAGETFALRFAGQLQRRDGYTRDLYDATDIDEDDVWSIRVGALWNPTDSITSYTLYEKSKRDQASSGWRLYAVNPTGAYAAFPGVVDALQATLARLNGKDWHTVENDQVALEQADTWSLSNNTTFELGGLTFKNILAYRDVKTFGRFDYDGSAVRVTGSGTGSLSLFNSQNVLDGDQWSDEFQVLGTALDGHLEWITGAFWFKEDNYDDQRSDLFGRRANVGTGINESKSLFAQGTYHFAGIDKLSATAGYRHTWDDRELISENQIQGLTEPALGCRLRNADGSIPDPCRRVSNYEDDAPTYTLGLEYRVNDATLTYVSYDHGYRSGGLQLRANRETEVQTFDPETVDDYEVGLKTTMDLGPTVLRVNLAAFYSDYQDIQRTISYIPTGQTILSTAVLNAAAATIKGGELEVTFLPIDNLQISGFVGYTHAQYDSFPNPGGITLPVPGKPLEDNEFAMLPDTTASVNVRYTLPMGTAGEAALQVGWYMQTEMPISDINDPNGFIDGYDLFNASVEWNHVMETPLDVQIYGKNLTDEDYSTGGTSVWTTGFITHILGAPRTYGIDLRYRFGQ